MERKEQTPRTERRSQSRAGPPPWTERYRVQVRAPFVRLSRPAAAPAS